MKWFFNEKLEVVPIASKRGLAIIVIFLVAVALGVFLGFELRDPSEDAAKSGFPPWASKVYFGTAVAALLLTFANMMARGMSPAGFAGATLGSATVLSRVAVSGLGDGNWLIVAILLSGLTWLLTFGKKRLRE